MVWPDAGRQGSTLSNPILHSLPIQISSCLRHDRRSLQSYQFVSCSLVVIDIAVALLAVSPMQGVEGPSVFMGALGSCSRPSNEAGVNCTAPTVSPKYDLSVLPSNAPDLLSAPTATTPAFIAVSLAFAILFFILFTLTSFHEKMGKFGARLDKPVIHRLTAWIGFLGFMIGITSFLVLRMWFEKAVEDFNDDVSKDGSGAPQLVAFTSNGFVMVWIAYAFYAVPSSALLPNFMSRQARVERRRRSTPSPTKCFMSNKRLLRMTGFDGLGVALTS
ncbi:hypothetical protein A0H81_01175 [Grifola frondosa]|uniref:Uncharacterized protein n=1 Tax=Grifola frondosa TaxID=5627 RepID=A0A1C7MQJ8_GRIFR|nr:hypothetical protein A0H81_01175 [Grifola frondosa]